MKKFFILILATFFSSLTYSQSWVQLSTVGSFDINSIAVVDLNTIWVCGTTGKVFKSTNGGFNWTQVTTGLPTGDLYGISATDANNCWVGTATGSIYYTSNGGTSWTLQIAVSGSFINGIKMFSNTFGVYTGDPTGSGQPYQMRRTTNSGSNWINAATSPIAANEFGVINAWDWSDTTNFWVGSANLTPSASTTKIYRTTTGFHGTWQAVSVIGTGGTAGLYYQAIAFGNATSGMAGSNGSNIVKTTDGGASWSPVGNPPGVTTYAAITANGVKDGSNTIRFVISDGTNYKVFKTTNYGGAWTQETIPASAASLGLAHMQFLNSNLGYCGGNSGVFIRFGPPLGIDPVNNNIPANYLLEQNYPNPFNPSTTVKFSLPKSSFVTLKIYDALGNAVKTVINGDLTPGNYSRTIDMSSFASGIYFYSIKAGDFNETKKMTLVK